MGMGAGPAPVVGIEPLPIPRAGLERIRGEWTGRGQLLQALAAVQPERQWSARDVERRVHRVLFDSVRDDLALLPESVRRWNDLLPAATTVARIASRRPEGRIDWARTRRGAGRPISLSSVYVSVFPSSYWHK